MPVATSFLILFSVPGRRNATFWLKSHLFALLRLWGTKVTFGAKVTFGSKSGFWEEFPLDLVLFLKPLERSAPSVISDGEETAFAEKFTKFMTDYFANKGCNVKIKAIPN